MGGFETRIQDGLSVNVPQVVSNDRLQAMKVEAANRGMKMEIIAEAGQDYWGVDRKRYTVPEGSSQIKMVPV